MNYLQQTYVNDKGVHIFALIPTQDYVLPNGEMGREVKFTAMGQTMIMVPGQGPLPYTFTFQIPGATPDEAFEAFPAAFEQAKKEAEVQARADYRKQMLLAGATGMNGHGRIK